MKDSRRFPVYRIDHDRQEHIEDDVVVEEPLEIRLNGDSLAVTMRTPGDDFDLASGFLWTEGIIAGAVDIGTIAFCPDEREPALQNILNVTLSPGVTASAAGPTRRWVNSSCGLCGKTTLDEIRKSAAPIRTEWAVEAAVLSSLPVQLRRAQANFDRTGGIHAAALFDPSGKLILIREDLGRHNAVDKVLGAALRSGIPVDATILMVSGRLGFEIAQKAFVARIPIVASVSAPSSLAVELAVTCGMTAVGFVRGRSMNIYSHNQRVTHALSKHTS